VISADDQAQATRQDWLSFLVAGLIIGGILVLSLGYGLSSGQTSKVGGLILLSGLIAALRVDRLSGFGFTLWILIANLAALLLPEWFGEVGGLSLTDSWLLLVVVQAIMFGMGTQMSLRDFAQVARMPLPAGIGLACQFLIMPLVGYSLAKIFRFPPEIGAGLVLIGSCSSGLASNVLTFLAKGNLALSVTMTAFATALAPVITPLWMKALAGSMVHVDGLQMSLDIVRMVIVPLLAAFVSELLQSPRPEVRGWVISGCLISLVWLLTLALGGWQWMLSCFSDQGSVQLRSLLSLPGFVAAAFVVGAAYYRGLHWFPALSQWMPRISMWGIVYFTLVTTAKGRDELLDVGLLLVLATALHNLLGYVLGYWAGRCLGLSRQDARTVAIEVGTQNGAMATGLARSMNKLETVGLAAVIFAPLMNVTGSIIANYWRRSSCMPTSPNG
jgi:BASS family bile acid:Na+ symporter